MRLLLCFASVAYAASCENENLIIRKDGTIRSADDVSLCASAKNCKKTGDVRNQTKLFWKKCNLEDENYNMKWDYKEGMIVPQESDKFAWTVKDLNRAKNQIVRNF